MRPIRRSFFSRSGFVVVRRGQRKGCKWKDFFLARLNFISRWGTHFLRYFVLVNVSFWLQPKIRVYRLNGNDGLVVCSDVFFPSFTLLGDINDW